MYDNFGDKMILTFDVGNSDIVFVAYQNDQVVKEGRIETKSEAFDSYFQKWLQELVPDTYLNLVEGIIVGSVVPRLSKRFIKLVEDYFSLKVTTFQIDDLPDFKALIDNPFELGVDLIAGAYGGYALYQKPLIIVDAGSATKISLINHEGNFVGCTIAPGLGISRQAMLSHIKHLPTFDYHVPESVIGRTTIDSLQAGLILGNIGGITYIAELLTLDSKEPVLKLLTGGYGYYLKEGLKDYLYLPDLVNFGLLKIYQTLQQKNK